MAFFFKGTITKTGWSRESFVLFTNIFFEA
jgi:hypothetical protein